MSIMLTGGCACGAIRYECETRPAVMLNCHCTDCQHFTGSAYAPLAVVMADNFCLMQGEPKHFVTISDHGNTVRRGFCPECGSSLFVATAAMPAYIAILAGSLDDPSLYMPSADLWARSAQAWDCMNQALARYETEPGSA